MMIQGIHYVSMMSELWKRSAANVHDLAGNAFNGWCCGVALLTSLAIRGRAWHRRSRLSIRAPPCLNGGSQEDDAESISDLFEMPDASALDMLLEPRF